MESKNEISYQIAVQMLNQEGNLLWNRFNVFLTANSIIIATIGILITTGNVFDADSLKEVQHLYCWLIIVGMLLCLGWGVLTLHGFIVCSGYTKIVSKLEKIRKNKVISMDHRPNSRLAPPCAAFLTIFAFLIVYFIMWGIKDWECLVTFVEKFDVCCLPPFLAVIIIIILIVLYFYLNKMKDDFKNTMKDHFKKEQESQQNQSRNDA